MIKYSWYHYILGFFGLGVIALIVSKLEPTNEEYVCEKYRLIVSQEIIGKVQERFIDEDDHNKRKIIYRDQQSNFKTLNLSFDGSKAFYEIKIGDVISKKRGSSEIWVNNDRKFTIDYFYDCE